MKLTMNRSRCTEIEVKGLTKRYGHTEVLRDVSFTAKPGRVTGFLGPNGAGKTTTLSILCGLVRPTTGQALIGGIPYQERKTPMREVGATLNVTSFHPGRTGRDHLRVLAAYAKVNSKRVTQVIDLVGLTKSAQRPVSTYSLGMRQRLALAGAMLGEPSCLVLDEPTNGLDPEGVRWLRELLHEMADDGRTVLVSSHILSEVEQVADDVVVISSGRVVHHSSMKVLVERGQKRARLLTPTPQRFLEVADRAHWAIKMLPDGRIDILDIEPERVGAIAHENAIAVYELKSVGDNLEESFFNLIEPMSEVENE